jgi:steroid delta-isomerase-like uncharacterized protein
MEIKMAPADTSEVLQRIADAWNAHDPDAVAAFYAEDVEVRDVAFPEPLHGRQAIRDLAAGYMAAFSDLRVEISEPIVSGNRSAQEWKVTGTNDGELQGMPATGKSATTYGCGILELGDDGLVHRGASYWNAAALMAQLGVTPAAAGATA